MAPQLRLSSSAARRGRLHISALPFSSRLIFLIRFGSTGVLTSTNPAQAAEDMASNTKTVAGHNLDPTPWHPFPQIKERLRPLTVLRCVVLSCPSSPPILPAPRPNPNSPPPRSCPNFFRAIHRDLDPWRSTRISAALVAEAGKRAAMRVVILEGRRLFVDLYYACVQSRALVTIWGLLQLLRRYPGMVPDVDLMFDCMDRPTLHRFEFRPSNGSPNASSLPIPPPLFRYCTTEDHFDIPFPDWSFWSWPEINIRSWNEEFQSIKRGSQNVKWNKKDKTAYWKGNPFVDSPIREALLSCNDSNKWGAQIMLQDWVEESKSGFQKSSLSSQCNYRYKIYAEGFAWSVSLKYILACGSIVLFIDPQYEDFFTRGLVPKENFWPVSPTELCQSIKLAVDWGNSNPSEAEAIGKKGQSFMEELEMDRVYDYMYHLLVEYSKLQDFKPVPPPSAQEVCADSILCLTDEKQRQFLETSYASPSTSMPCTLPPPGNNHQT
ncbi:hypothetical protein ZIOFF_026212 [Zingiber officinale]|uniref:Glycosyl transferase CAP10 domain-containing protein n=1 Tax=Zingiber officinale TaxID=94328 RepID=A0A8J5GVM0_ZINOF|nr:hypothetical protein ZIOFF_026212 [Zingiber officinale]